MALRAPSAIAQSGSITHLQVLLSLYCRRDSGAGWGLRYLRTGRHRVARGGLRGINRDRQWTGVSAAGSPVWCCGRGRGCQGGCRRDRVCGAGPVGAVLHIRPGPAVEGSAESCGNALTINSGEILPCAERAPLHMGERQQEDDDLREPRNRAENPESDRGVFSSMCNNLRNRPGKDLDRLRGNLTGNSPLSEPCRMSTPPHRPRSPRRHPR